MGEPGRDSGSPGVVRSGRIMASRGGSVEECSGGQSFVSSGEEDGIVQHLRGLPHRR